MSTFAQQIDALIHPGKTPADRRRILVSESDGINPRVVYTETDADIAERLWRDAALAWLARIDVTATNAVGTARIMLERFDAAQPWPATADDLAALLEARARLSAVLGQAADYQRRAQAFAERMVQSIKLGTVSRKNAGTLLPGFDWNAVEKE